MINMMYLVLTAMLALNISAEVLEAFTKVDDSIQKSIGAVNAGSSVTYRALSIKAANDPSRTPFLDRANEAKRISDSLYGDIELLKEMLREESGVRVTSSGKKVLRNGRDTHTPTHLLINEGKGAMLKQKINATREALLALYDSADLELGVGILPLHAVDPEPDGQIVKTWEEDLFYEMPVVASLAMLSKIQNDVRASEAQTLKYLLDEAGMDDFPFNSVMATAIPKARWVTVGDRMNIDLMVSAFDSNMETEVFIGPLNRALIRPNVDGVLEVIDKDLKYPPLLSVEQKLVSGSRGIATLQQVPMAVGTKRVTGVIKVVNKDDGSISWFPFDTEYEVIRPAAVVSPDNMNVLYLGVDNPISISVPGFTDDKVSATISSGTLTKQSGKYIARVSQTGTTTVRVTAQTETVTKPMGDMEFKVKRLPPPEVALSGRPGGQISVDLVRNALGLTATAPWFHFPIPYRIEEFHVVLNPAGTSNQIPKSNSSAVFSADVRELLRRARPRDRLYFDNVVVALPDRKEKVHLSFLITP